MKNKLMGRVFRLLLCAILCVTMVVPLAGPALAYDGSGEEQDITIRITPPQNQTAGAAVEVCITDNAGAGFQSAQVKAGGDAWRDVTAGLIQTENRWCCVVDITESCTVSVKVTGRDGTVYEKSGYIQCSGSAAPTPGDTGAPRSSTPPGGQGTVIDNVSGTSGESGREFFTIATPDENVFYLVIDRQRDSENVYFLNAVSEADLMALAEKDAGGPSQSAVPDPDPVCSCTRKCVPGAVDASCPVCILSWQGCTGTVEAPGQTAPEPEKPKDGGGTGTVVIVLLAALAVGAAGWYIKIYKPKHDLADAEDLDELMGGAEEEPTVNEDDLPAAVPYPEPDEPDYPDGYGDGA